MQWPWLHQHSKGNSRGEYMSRLCACETAAARRVPAGSRATDLGWGEDERHPGSTATAAPLQQLSSRLAQTTTPILTAAFSTGLGLNAPAPGSSHCIPDGFQHCWPGQRRWSMEENRLWHTLSLINYSWQYICIISVLSHCFQRRKP